MKHGYTSRTENVKPKQTVPKIEWVHKFLNKKEVNNKREGGSKFKNEIQNN